MTLKRCSVSDLMGKLTQRTLTDEGYLVAPGNLSRAGNVQEYFASELGMDEDGMDPRQVIRMFRPVDEVFSPEALKSFDSKPITLTHPPKPVTSVTWKGVAVGDVDDIRADAAGKHMVGTLTIRDQDAINAVLDGTRELSCGYSFDPDMTAGVTADGQEYDGSMRNIRGNHHAIVDMARGGYTCRIGDRDPTTRTRRGVRDMEPTNNPVKKTIDGIALTFVDDAQASMVEKIVADARAALKTAEEARDAAVGKLETSETALGEEKTKSAKLVADHGAEITALKAQIPSAEQLAAVTNAAQLATDHAAEVAKLKAQIPTPEQVEKLAVQYAKGVSDAKTVIPTFDATGKTLPAIRREVLALVIDSNDALKHVAKAGLRGVEPNKAADDVVHLSFDSVVAAKGIAVEDDGRGSVNDPEVGADLAGRGANDARPTAKRKPLTGYDLLRWRERNGGKNPDDKATA